MINDTEMENPSIDIENKRTSGAHVSFWTESNPNVKTKPLEESTQSTAVIIGAGISGLTTAYTLSKKGIKVIVLEDGFIGSGESGRTTAHLVTALDDRYYTIQKVHGEKNTSLAAESHAKAIDYIEQIVEEENIDCNFKRVDGYLFLHPSDKLESIQKEYEAATLAGVHVEIVHQVPGMLHSHHEALKFYDQAQFHIMKYLNGLCAAILRMGGEIYTETRAEKIEPDSVTTDKGHVIKTEHIVVATNAPITSMYVLPLKQYPFRTYVIGALIKKGEIAEALWWDTGNSEENNDISPYHYVRTAEYNDEYDILISGGEDHPTGLADANGTTEEHRYEKLERWTREHFAIEEVVYKWSGQVMEPMDSLAYIGRSPGKLKNLYVITGDSGNGMTHGTIGGMLIPDLIQGIKNPWEQLYDPSRFKFFQSGKTFLKQNINTIIQYLMTNPKNMDAEKLKSLKPGEGTIIKYEKEKFGVYRDVQNKFHWVSAECTHLKCIVKWNNDEKTWDCPCHGSRFNFKGEVLNGPANDPLDYHEDDHPDTRL